MAVRPAVNFPLAPLARALLLALLASWVAPCALPVQAASAEEAAQSTPKIYKWIDENGIAHYTTDVERIPKAIRDQIGRQRGSPGDSAGDTGTAEDRPSPRPRSSVAGERGFSQDARPKPTETEFDDGSEVGADASALAELDRRIAELEAEIAGDEEILKTLISSGADDAVSGDEQVATLRDLGGRLPEALEELEALRAERAALGP